MLEFPTRVRWRGVVTIDSSGSGYLSAAGASQDTPAAGGNPKPPMARAEPALRWAASRGSRPQRVLREQPIGYLAPAIFRTGRNRSSTP
jgi:hypothetical protein